MTGQKYAEYGANDPKVHNALSRLLDNQSPSAKAESKKDLEKKEVRNLFLDMLNQGADNCPRPTSRFDAQENAGTTTRAFKQVAEYKRLP